MCLASTQPGGPARCSGHTEDNLRTAETKLSETITEQAELSAEILPMEQQVLRHRTIAAAAGQNNNAETEQRHLAEVDRLEAQLEERRGRARKLAALKQKQIGDLAEKQNDYYATGRGLQKLQAEIDANRAAAADPSLREDSRREHEEEAERLQSIANRSKIRMDTEEQERLKNAQAHGWEYQVKETLPIAEPAASGAASDRDDAFSRANRFSSDRSVSMTAQGIISQDDPSVYSSYTVTIGNSEGKTVTVDLENYTDAPSRDPQDPLSAMAAAPSRSDVALSLSRLYSNQRDEPNFEKFQAQNAAQGSAGHSREFEEADRRWKAAARERARLKKVLGDDKFEELVAISQ